MVGEQKSAPITSVNQVGLSQKSLEIKVIRQIAAIDCSAVPFSKLEIKTRDNGKPYSAVVTRTYMIDEDGNVT